MWCVCVCVCVYAIEYYSAIKNDEILPFATTWIDTESIMLSEVRWERQIPDDFTHVWKYILIKKYTNEQTK